MGYSKKRKRKQNRAKDQQSLVFSDGQEAFWEVDTVLGRRFNTDSDEAEYLIKWVGCPKSEATWEPSDNLCDSALREAEALDRAAERAEHLQKGEKDSSNIKDGATLLAELTVVEEPSDEGGDDSLSSQQKPEGCAIYPENRRSRSPSPNIDPPPKPPTPPPATPPKLEDNRWYWTDQEQVKYRDVERINVNDTNAQQRVTDARLNGTPIVLVGHVGWANFAKKWLVPTHSESMEAGQRTSGSELLDLAKEHRLDIDQMIDHIGHDMVPFVNLDYNEQNPLQGNIKASAFLKTCWPSADGKCKSDERLYLHQWQFPLSETSGRKLCHKNNTLPNKILGEDLLKYWLDLPQCKLDCPFQYIFMGREGTMSKLHRDNGGLAISIAPIVGVKECVLVHRSDGATCLYHLDASLENVDLNRFPLMAHARVWKTEVKPGEILLMPQGTYHQCRNLTPCLSYSRFHLDTLNLMPFLQSMIDGDAEELEHAEIIWNCCTELMKAIDKFSDACHASVQAEPPPPPLLLSDDMAELVYTLRSLCNICREIARRLNGKKRVRKENDNIGTAHDWTKMVDDVDDCLHHFRFRLSPKIPAKPRRKKASAAALEDSARCLLASDSVRIDGDGDFANDMAGALAALPHKSPFRMSGRRPREDELQPKDNVVVRFQGREVLGTIFRVEKRINAAFLTYDGYPPIYNEYQPYDKLRVSMGGEQSSVEISPNDVKEGARVLNRWGDTGEVYRALVVRTCCQDLFYIQLHLSDVHHLDRWLPVESITSWANLDSIDEIST